MLGRVKYSHLDAITQIASQCATHAEAEHLYRALAMSVMKILQVRACLISVRDRDDNHNHVSMSMVRIGMHLPDGKTTLGSHYEILRGPEHIDIAKSEDGPHLSMHSVAAWSGDTITIVDGNEDPKIKMLQRSRRHLDEWSNKTAFFVCWHDDRPIPICIASFASNQRLGSTTAKHLQSQEWANYHRLCHQRLNERHYSPIELDDISERDRHILKCIALYPADEVATKLGITHKSYRRRRSILAKRLGITPEKLSMAAAQWTIPTTTAI